MRKVLFHSLCLLMLSACSGFVNDVELNSYTQDGSIYGDVHVDLRSEEVPLPTVSIPILNPKDQSEVIGRLDINGVTRSLDVLINLSAVANLPASVNNLLPNGSSIPVAGFDSSQLVTIPIGYGGSQIYVSYDVQRQRAFVGTAIIISGLNPGAFGNFFVPFTIRNQIDGTAGIFMSLEPNKSGFAVFADISGIFPPQMHATDTNPELGYSSSTPSSSDMKKLNKELKRLQSSQTPAMIR